MNSNTDRIPTGIREQIEELRKNHLEISGPEEELYIAQILQKTSYYRLIKGYGAFFKMPNEPFPPGVHINNLIDIYQFDEQLSDILFPVIRRVEINLRCRIANTLCECYGDYAYQDMRTYSSTTSSTNTINAIERIKETAMGAGSPIMAHFKDNQGEMPLYALIELFTLGNLVSFFRNLSAHVQNEIINTGFNGYNRDQFLVWLEYIALLRNRVYHHDRLYDRTFEGSRPLTLPRSAPRTVKRESLYAVLLCVERVFNTFDTDFEDWSDFVDELIALTKRHPSVDVEKMGFIADWSYHLKKVDDCYRHIEPFSWLEKNLDTLNHRFLRFDTTIVPYDEDEFGEAIIDLQDMSSQEIVDDMLKMVKDAFDR